LHKVQLNLASRNLINPKTIKELILLPLYDSTYYDDESEIESDDIDDDDDAAVDEDEMDDEFDGDDAVDEEMDDDMLL
jgi:hypothetical protein